MRYRERGKGNAKFTGDGTHEFFATEGLHSAVSSGVIRTEKITIVNKGISISQKGAKLAAGILFVL